MHLEYITEAQKPMTPEKYVNSLGKYLYKHLDGAFAISKGPQTCQVRTIVLYQVPLEIRKMYDLDESYDDVNEMVIDIDITCYSNKLRINLTELDPEERTLGHTTYGLEAQQNNQKLQNAIMKYLRKRLYAIFDGYEFLF